MSDEKGMVGGRFDVHEERWVYNPRTGRMYRIADKTTKGPRKFVGGGLWK